MAFSARTNTLKNAVDVDKEDSSPTEGDVDEETPLTSSQANEEIMRQVIVYGSRSSFYCGVYC